MGMIIIPLLLLHLLFFIIILYGLIANALKKYNSLLFLVISLSLSAFLSISVVSISYFHYRTQNIWIFKPFFDFTMGLSPIFLIVFGFLLKITNSKVNKYNQFIESLMFASFLAIGLNIIQWLIYSDWLAMIFDVEMGY